MPYIMVWHVDGGCRGNGTPYAKAAAAAIRSTIREKLLYTQKLPYTGLPHTNQRAELTALLMALRESVALHRSLAFAPLLDVTIPSDSQYAIFCLTTWLPKWIHNGYLNSKGLPVHNQDLICEGSTLHTELQQFGNVTLKWIRHEENGMADAACQKVLDEM